MLATGLIKINRKEKHFRQGLRDTLFHEYKNKSLGVGLILCLFNFIIVVGPLVEPITCLAIDSLSDNGVRYGFHLVEWGLTLV